MDALVSQLFAGLSLGSVLLLAALGLALTFGQMGVINMAHGEFMMAGAYTAYVVQGVWGDARVSVTCWAAPAAGYALPSAYAWRGTVFPLAYFPNTVVIPPWLCSAEWIASAENWCPLRPKAAACFQTDLTIPRP